MTTLKSYEVDTLTNGVQTITDVKAASEGAEFISFYGADSSLIIAFRISAVISYRPVPAAEQVIVPKHLYRVQLNGGAAKEVKADLYRLTSIRDGADQVYEFFTRTPDGTREELTVPFASVQFVERIEPEAPVTTAVIPETLVVNADAGAVFTDVVQVKKQS